MGLLDGHNPMAGAFSGPVPAFGDPLVAARRWATLSVVAAVLWLFGFGSLVAVIAGGFAWLEYRRAGRSATLALLGIAGGVVGLAIAFATFV